MSFPNSQNIQDQPTIKGLPEACVFVSPLSLKTNEEGLHKYFEQFFGRVLKTTIMSEAVRPYGFVQFQELSSAKASVASTETHILDGSRIRVEKARVNSTLFLAKIPKGMINADLRALCEEYGKVESATIIKERGTQESKGCAFVKFVYREDSLDAMIGLKETYETWAIEWAKNTKESDHDVDRKAIFVGGLDSFQVTEQLVSEKFGRFGEIESISLVKPMSRNNDISEEVGGESSRSAYVFIRYLSAEPAIRAIENENGTEWMGKRLRVQHPDSAETKRDKERKRSQPNPAPMGAAMPPYYYLPYPMPYPYPGSPSSPPNSLQSPPLHSNPLMPSAISPGAHPLKTDHVQPQLLQSQQNQSQPPAPTYISPPSGYAPPNSASQGYYPYPWIYAGAAPSYPQ